MSVRVYAYGADDPTENAALVEAEIRKAHNYRNALVAVERERRARVDATLARLSPGLAGVERALAGAELEVERLKTALTGFKRGDRSPSATAARAAVREAQARRKTFYAERKVLRAPLFASPEVEEIEEWSRAEEKRLRAEESPYWGTSMPRLQHRCSDLDREG